jgi:alkanesulfonate monooxygenase SsuD/methylene tetrahydromethanopterin reductase-like flavin-dependent oxidoreductase (luciferase family)
MEVRSRGEAAYAFHTTPEIARQFVEVWDRLWGSNRRCTQMLREAIEHAGLFDDEASLVEPEPGKITVS